MKEKLEKAIETVAGCITKDTSADDALKYTQAAVNAANALRCLRSK